MNIRDAVYAQVETVAREQEKRLPPLSDDMRLLESGLDSLSMAIIIANLDDGLKLRPFESDDTIIPVTLGDLVNVYVAADNAAA